ncbi:MAG: polysaccharide deacetylase family protein [Waterburya sp.]
MTSKENQLNQGTLTISLDFELYWGMRDVVSVEDYQQHLKGVRQAVPAILELFEQYNIHATWATVGFLYYANQRQLQENLPQQLPSYHLSELSPYKYIKDSGSELSKELHFCPELIELIKQYPGQEIGTHTFSHYYCLETGQSQQEFQADLEAAIKTAQKANIATKSLVFPRNQYNQDYLAIIEHCGIACYRGNETHRIYNSEAGDGNSATKRLLRLLDTYVNISGQNCYSWSELKSSYPVNIPSSRFLRPYSAKLRYLDGLRLRRTTSGLQYAANHNQVYHLWWHPHNFGVNLTENLNFLTKILHSYQQLNAQNQMQSLNMAEVAELSQYVNGLEQTNTGSKVVGSR